MQPKPAAQAARLPGFETAVAQTSRSWGWLCISANKGLSEVGCLRAGVKQILGLLVRASTGSAWGDC
jgi:hypothetical protein